MTAQLTKGVETIKISGKAAVFFRENSYIQSRKHRIAPFNFSLILQQGKNISLTDKDERAVY